MKAISIIKPGGPEALQLVQKDKPIPKMGEVLIRVKAAGINRPDIAQRKGRYPAPKDAPADIPGLEVAGIVEQVGENVSEKVIGQEICALISGGGYAEYVCAPWKQCLPVPAGATLEEAASLPETFFTVWNNVFDIGKFTSGETVLIHGGSSGIGVTAIQIVKAMGGKVVVTAGTDEKCQACIDLGADLAINYKTQDFEQEVKNSGSIEGVDIVLDMIGGEYTPKNIALMNPFGRIVMINAMKGKDANVDLIQIMKKRLVLTGSTLRPQTIEYKGKIADKLREKIWPFFHEKIKPVIFKTFPLAEASAAHELLESSNHIGKLLLVNS
ncbi:NAD(P)H-quinone oxidoreductase [Litoribacter populi]|uniref:NAD(P)H-quinone oxidoreductase n=1 Tax=Litoribacter populi TaxID=2598460 RepID=UPI0011802185|nr:NAD(P)H-quinone oxidoreductase [Litoribacter populi]